MSQTTTISKPAPSKAKQGFIARFLDPIDRITEAIYAVLIVMGHSTNLLNYLTTIFLRVNGECRTLK